jgi:TonB-dependent starch-binding outer membrane protein SusC
MRSLNDVPHGRAARRVAAALCLLLALPITAVVAAAQTGTVSGTVSDQSNNAPIPSAQVVIVGTTRGTLSGSDGKYTIPGVPSGPAQIRITRIGFASETRPVTVPTSSTATVDFLLAATQVTLDQVVVTGTQTTERSREAGNVISVIQTDSISKAAVNSFSELITAKAPGVNVTQSSGEIGTGARIRIRGSNSVSLPNDPLLIVDGIWVNNSANSISAGAGVGGQTPSRFDDLNPNEIENVEVLKGPSAAALYGSAGANGVIIVTTKTGASGKAEWTAHADYGQALQVATFPTNFGQPGINTASGNPTGNCTLIYQAGEVNPCTVSGAIQYWNPLESHVATPFSSSNPIQRFGGSVAGGSGTSRYFLNGDYDFTHGVYPNNFLNRNSMRANFSTSPSQNLDFSVNAGYMQSRSQLPQNDNNEFSPIASGVLGAPFNPGPPSYGYLLVTPGEAQSLIVTQDVERFTGGLTGNLRALNWLTFTGVAGIDFTERDDGNYYPPGVLNPGIFGENTASGFALSNPFQFWDYTAQINAQAVYPFSSTIHGTTSIGTQYSNQIERGTYAQGYGLAPGTSTVAGATNLFAASELGNNQIVTIGYYIQQQASFGDLLFLTAALRADDNSAFGQNFQLAYYPSISASWVIGEEPWFAKNSIVSSLRLRAAFGYSGQRPQFQEAQTYFNAVPYHVPGLGEVGGLAYGNFGNPNLKPELSNELEGGFDAGFWHDKIQLQLTGYMKTTNDALIAVNNPVSVGGVTFGSGAGTSTRFLNIGEVDNRGFEALLTSNLVDTRDFRFDFTINASMNKNKLITLGPGQPPIPLGLSTVNGQFIQQQMAGFPLASFFQPNFTCGAPVNGIVVPSACTVAAASTYHGPSFPEQLLSLNPSVIIFRYFRISTLFDNRNVSYSFNATQQFRCSLYNFVNCNWDYEKGTSIKNQSAVVGDYLGTDAGFIESTAFWKWREISLTMTAPDQWARAMKLRGFNVVIAGRNLHTWTPYQGSDPETNFNGSDNFTTTDFFTQPLVQTWIGRINLFF